MRRKAEQGQGRNKGCITPAGIKRIKVESGVVLGHLKIKSK